MQILDEFGMKYIFPEGAFYVYIYVDEDSVKLAHRLSGKKLLVMPSTLFGNKNNDIRISYAVDVETLKKGLEVLTKTIQKDSYEKQKMI